MSVNVRVLYTEDCANTPSTVRLIERVAQDMGIVVQMDYVSVTSQAQAEALRFLGSPTVQIDGQYIEPAARHLSDFGLM
jgi:hypothetical protein